MTDIELTRQELCSTRIGRFGTKSIESWRAWGTKSAIATSGGNETKVSCAPSDEGAYNSLFELSRFLQCERGCPVRC